MTTNRFVGGSAVLPINKFRDDEFLNEDNKYNKIVFENARKYILSQMNEDTMKPLNQITDQQKYVLTMLIQRFLNELDSSVKKYYDNTDTDNAEKLIFKWNELVNYYNTNVDKAFKPILDSRLGGDGDVLEKLEILMDVAQDANYSDKVEIIKLRNYVNTNNYKTIQNIIFRKGEEQELPETRMEQVKSGDFNVRRMRFPKVGRPRRNVDVEPYLDIEPEKKPVGRPRKEPLPTPEKKQRIPPPPPASVMEARRLQEETDALIDALQNQMRGQYIDVETQQPYPYFDLPPFEESDFTETPKPITPKPIIPKPISPKKIKLKKK